MIIAADRSGGRLECLVRPTLSHGLRAGKCEQVVAPRPETPDANDKPPGRVESRRTRAGRQEPDARVGSAGPASTAFKLRRVGAGGAGLAVDRRALEGLTPELSRAEGVGLND